VFLVIGSSTIFESLLLFEQIEGRKLMSGAILVPDPGGQEFKLGHSKLRDR
jgi:hypothetical protein